MIRSKNVVRLSILTLLLGISSTALADEYVARDAQGRMLEKVEKSGRIYWYTYDADGRMVEERRSDGSVIRYDKNGRPQDASRPR